MAETPPLQFHAEGGFLPLPPYFISILFSSIFFCPSFHPPFGASLLSVVETSSVVPAALRHQALSSVEHRERERERAGGDRRQVSSI